MRPTTPARTPAQRNFRHLAAGVSSSLFALLVIALFTPTAALAAEDTQGFVYGKVTAESGTVYQGRLRWNEDEEAFWGDLFNGSKEDRPYMVEVPRRERVRDRDEIRVFGIRISSRNWGSSNRSFVARFGDIRSIEVIGGNEAILTMSSGTKYELDGGSNDLGATIYVWDDEFGEIGLDWDKIDRIDFLPTPKNLDVSVFRLHGKVVTDAGDFEGYIQWDQEECLSTDELDGESDDGDLAIAMGKIRSIERRSRRSSRVILESGRDLVLDGTNDVDDDNRGIFVEDERFGRVLVSWEAFDRVDFTGPGSSGPALDDFESGPIQGTVTDRDGKKTSGRIVYDIDESETWEMLNGEWRDVEYNIPFGLIRSVVPKTSDSSEITLKNGKVVELEGQVDVGDGNAGILIFSGDGDPVYVAWDDLERIDFE